MRHKLRPRLVRAAGLAALFALSLSASTARAADEEIQVYIDDLLAKGAFGLDVHVNDVLKGRLANVDYVGQQTSQDRVRVTPEWAYGLTPNIELGAYLPLMTFADGHGEIGGAKGRIKFIAPRPEGDGVFWGVNFELGRVRKDIDINPWNAELKGILGLHKGPWTLAENLNIDWAVSGPERGPASYQLATMVTRKIGGDDFDVGFESYNTIGDAKRLGPLSVNDQQLFLIMDKGLGKWDLNLGVGWGYGRPEDHLILKAIIGVPIG
ncbi:hypothetical protein [Phenylobacterium sp.]|uniref:hypothetical protein n=1 Tax=Phenylobacterium sp. TaxID=1871053 RepID=UPI002CD430CF|nr:hypothetical protein [Phenylobacterium sp.]HLZ74195.1 hypothetical protein [Phenylobacterium sp.]